MLDLFKAHQRNSYTGAFISTVKTTGSLELLSLAVKLAKMCNMLMTTMDTNEAY